LSEAQILILGAVAGFTIYLGLPVGRLRNPALGLKAFLSAAATGILLFLLWDVLTAASGPIESALRAASKHDGSWLRFLALAALFAACFSIGLLSLVYYDRWLADRRAARLLGPGAASAAEFERPGIAGFTPARSLALTGAGRPSAPSLRPRTSRS
jgi:zinc transporter, ZIP family